MDIAALIATHKGDQSYSDLAKGSGLSRQAWQQLATLPIARFPDPATITAIARTLRVSVDTVIRAAAVSVGLDVRTTSSAFADRLPRAVDDLPTDQQEALLVLIWSMVEVPIRPKKR